MSSMFLNVPLMSSMFLSLLVSALCVYVKSRESSKSQGSHVRCVCVVGLPQTLSGKMKKGLDVPFWLRCWFPTALGKENLHWLAISLNPDPPLKVSIGSQKPSLYKDRAITTQNHRIINFSYYGHIQYINLNTLLKRNSD